jgi:homoserine dehydrogenase
VTPAAGRRGRLDRVPVVLLGPGSVGRSVLRQIVDLRDAHAARIGVRLCVVAIADSAGLLVARDDEIGDADLVAIADHKEKHLPLGDVPPDACPGAVADDALDPARAEVLGVRPILVDTTAADTTASLLEARARAWGVVLANKIPLTGTRDAFEQITTLGRGARWETTVASSLPVIATLQTLMDRGDRIHWITGTLSGSLGFLAARLESGEPLSTAVAEAQRRGLTEPDPRTDLAGLDVARKALVLARMLGRRLELVDIAVEALYPRSWDDLDADAFRARLPGGDAALAARVGDLRASGSALRYVATIGTERVHAGLVGVERSSRLAGADATDSVVIFETDHYQANPLVISGRGGGPVVTAAGVVGDIVSLAREV